ncbi:MAG: HIT domain-containing protein [Anaerolineales bacterium]|nr:HIT domain-containing protein [Anaerolineales bacterium]
MKHLWSPWRRKYIEGHGTVQACIFCEALRQTDEQALILARLPRAFAILNRYPYTGGHLMVVPVAHEDAIDKLPEETWLEMFALTKRALAALRKVYRAPSFNLGVNLGECAGAGVAGHVHLHVVPRWPGDTNFLSVLGEVRVLPESLEDTWTKLRAGWEP